MYYDIRPPSIKIEKLLGTFSGRALNDFSDLNPVNLLNFSLVIKVLAFFFLLIFCTKLVYAV